MSVYMDRVAGGLTMSVAEIIKTLVAAIVVMLAFGYAIWLARGNLT